jgi:hypothetical protein
MSPVPKVDQGQVTTAIAAGRSAAHGDDTAAAEAVRLARLAGPDAVKFLRRVIVTEGWASLPQRVRASCAVLEVGGHLGDYPSAATGAFREPDGTDGTGEREEA